jgi:uncharacterized membrane protein YgcG
MTLQDREYDEILSRVLHSTLEAIDPAGDGLSKIQQRIAEPWLKRQWSLLIHEFTSLGWLIFVRAEPHLNEARSSLARLAESSGRWLRSTSLSLAARARVSSSGRHKNSAGREGPATVVRKWLGPAMAWLRPALAVGGAVVLVVVGVFAVGQAQRALSPSPLSANNPFAQGASPGASAGYSGTYGQQSNNSLAVGYPPVADRSPGHNKHATQPAAGVGASPAQTACPSSSPTPTVSPTPTPTPSASATPSPSPSPSASASATSSPSPSATGSSGSPSGGGSTSPGSGSSGGGSSGCGP